MSIDLKESSANEKQVDVETLPDGELIDFILERFHQCHRRQLKELITLAGRVEGQHGNHQLCPRGLARFLEAMSAELEQHMFKEENILFPMIRAGQGGMASGPISVMMHEHDEHGAAIDKLGELTHQLQLPSDACGSWRQLYSDLETFVADLNHHIELENTVLFARQQR